MGNKGKLKNCCRIGCTPAVLVFIRFSKRTIPSLTWRRQSLIMINKPFKKSKSKFKTAKLSWKTGIRW